VTLIQEALSALVGGRSLTEDEAAAATEKIMAGEATPAQIGAFLMALRVRGETPEEMAGMAKIMRAKALRVPTDGQVVDSCGTGGDGMGTFNISTAAALVAAAAGVKVAKHGNRAASGTVGSADILEANGVKLELSPESVQRCIEEVGIGFMFAPSFHPAMRIVAAPRRELGIRTVFNVLGPLTNPAGARYQVIGTASEELAEKMAQVLNILGTEHSWVVHGGDGLDEITITSETSVWEARGGRVRRYQVSPEDAGLGRSALQKIQARGEGSHAALFTQALGPEECAPKDVVMLNAAAALVVAGAAPDLRAGVIIAREVINAGTPMAKLRQLAELSQSLS
jgi:anthranilate phosphoribosyltransferase